MCNITGIHLAESDFISGYKVQPQQHYNTIQKNCDLTSLSLGRSESLPRKKGHNLSRYHPKTDKNVQIQLLTERDRYIEVLYHQDSHCCQIHQIEAKDKLCSSLCFCWTMLSSLFWLKILIYYLWHCFSHPLGLYKYQELTESSSENEWFEATRKSQKVCLQLRKQLSILWFCLPEVGA